MGDILIPDLVSEKIDYYIWRNNMSKCCQEYHRDFELMDGFCLYRRCHKMYYFNSFSYNFRNIGKYATEGGIYTYASITPNRVANLPKNYYYSNESIGT